MGDGAEEVDKELVINVAEDHLTRVQKKKLVAREIKEMVGTVETRILIGIKKAIGILDPVMEMEIMVLVVGTRKVTGTLVQVLLGRAMTLTGQKREIGTLDPMMQTRNLVGGKNKVIGIQDQEMETRNLVGERKVTGTLEAKSNLSRLIIGAVGAFEVEEDLEVEGIRTEEALVVEADPTEVAMEVVADLTEKGLEVEVIGEAFGVGAVRIEEDLEVEVLEGEIKVVVGTIMTQVTTSLLTVAKIVVNGLEVMMVLAVGPKEEALGNLEIVELAVKLVVGAAKVRAGIILTVQMK